MRVSPISLLNNSKFIPKSNKRNFINKNAAMGLAFLTCSFLPLSCSRDEIVINKAENPAPKDPLVYKYSEDIILPDTVSQIYLQDIKDIHEKINTVFKSLNIIEQTKNINDIKTLEFEDLDKNRYKISDVKQTNNGYEFHGTVNKSGVEQELLIKLSDGKLLIDRPFICMETSFNKMHNFSMIYQYHWRLGKNNTPERRLFQNRTNREVDSINQKEYYPYDSYNVFALRRNESGISSKAVIENNYHSANDEIKNIKVVYK